MVAKPNSRTMGSASSPWRLKISRAVKHGWKDWRKAARASRTPTAQKVNHLPMRSVSGSVECQ
jgi:hypothetical protein